MIFSLKTLTVVSGTEELLSLSVEWLQSVVKLSAGTVTELANGIFMVKVRSHAPETEISRLLKRRFGNHVRVVR